MGINIFENVASSIYIEALTKNNNMGNIILLDNINAQFNNQDIYLYSHGSINLLNNSNLILSNSNTKSLYMYTDLNCNDTEYSLKLSSYSSTSAIGNGITSIEYYGSGINLYSTSSTSPFLKHG